MTKLDLNFRTDKFRLTGELPPDCNAGNQMYGEDMAKWIVQELPGWELDYLDEDWGWAVLSGECSDINDPKRLVCHEICVYAYPDDAERAVGSNLGDWMLSISKREKREIRVLGLFKSKKWIDTEYDSKLAEELVLALSKIGITVTNGSNNKKNN